MLDYLIIGGGVTGITLCKKFREAGIDNILVLEAENEIGGLCRTKKIEGHNLDIGGGHFFHTKHTEIFDYVFKHMPKIKFNYYTRVSKILLNDHTIDYPVESNIWQLPIDEQISFLISIIRNGETSGKTEPANYEEWIRWKLGDKVCDEYMIPYNTKLWGEAPRDLDIDWLYKIPRVNVEEVLRYSLERKQDVSKFPAHIHFYYPKAGGFQMIIDALADNEKDKILVSTPVYKLRYEDNRWIINDQFETKKVINTAPWNDLYEPLGSPSELADDFNRIRYNRIVISLFEHEYQHKWHWRYIPDVNKAYHREFYIHNFSEDSKINGVYLETNEKRFAQLKNDSISSNIIYEEVTKAAYPIPIIGHATAIKRILDYYESKGLYGVGRWGQHQYQNADVSMYEAFKFVEREAK